MGSEIWGDVALMSGCESPGSGQPTPVGKASPKEGKQLREKGKSLLTSPSSQKSIKLTAKQLCTHAQIMSTHGMHKPELAQ